MISFKKLGQHGRLGNQLFQIYATRGLAEKHKTNAAFPNWRYEKYFINPLEHGEMSNKVFQEQTFEYQDLKFTEDADLHGYFQSPRYFPTYNHLKFTEDFIVELRERYPIFSRETVCIQVRRGDYVGNEYYYQLPITFYMHALMKYIPNWKECNILIISDDIEYCRVHFECLPHVTFSENKLDIEDMALGSQCDHFIISGSSFGWWTAWFGEKEHSKVIHSGKLFAGPFADQNSNVYKNDRDYWPKNWISHKQDNYKLPMQDVTFTIPVFFDHPDRKNNLDLSLCMLQKDLDAPIIIFEQGGNKFEYTSQWVTYHQFENKNFHRTKMLNEMAILSGTPLICNWDADVIISPIQLFMAAEKLRAGADMVFPYDGRFARMSKGPWFHDIQKSLDIGITRDTAFPGRVHGHNSVGGAVMFRTESFIQGGMENENMISFGPEDAERNDRFKRLGFDVQYTPGSLFHMMHYIGPNSSATNPFFRANHNELDKIRAMSDEELMLYVNTWPWRDPYTDNYYGSIAEGSIKSAKIVFESLKKRGFKMNGVLDIGCGVGEWNNGNPDYWGVDYRIQLDKLIIPKEHYLECDLNTSFPPTGRLFDLVLCLEVAEHLRASRAEGLVEYLCKQAKHVLFSAAIPYQGGTGHVNEQWQSWWAELFAKHNFYPNITQPDLNNDDIELWYRQNMILYSLNVKPKIVTKFVLPEYYEQIIKAAKIK